MDINEDTNNINYNITPLEYVSDVKILHTYFDSSPKGIFVVI